MGRSVCLVPSDTLSLRIEEKFYLLWPGLAPPRQLQITRARRSGLAIGKNRIWALAPAWLKQIPPRNRLIQSFPKENANCYTKKCGVD
jgi:hypothetical protein